MPTVSVRYIVDDVDAAIVFYCENLGFTEVMHPAPPFAMLARGDLRAIRREVARQCQMVRCRSRAAGTGSRSK
jgi:catechol 2,3-dioxygenase-like lactoylglutathione lyase family enzyme